jgi:NhaP-type Na+/H+ and K+/H+ antiporter
MSEVRDSLVASSHSTTLTVTLSPIFKLVFISVLGITVLSMFITCALVAVHNETDQGKALFELFASLTKMGFGAMVGLLGGKAI